MLDDEENYAEMLRDLLRDHNYRVDMATRPERAINQLEEIPYDLVISDYKMPVMDGADFLKRARELYPNLPFILVSGLMNTPELVKVANMSVTLVMEKPLDTAAFLEHVARFSVPMTEDEKAALSEEGEPGSSAVKAVTSYPEEPRYLSAACALSKRFMLDLWSLCHSGNCAFIHSAVGGDFELAAKDISSWRGNRDKPVGTLSFEQLMADGVAALQAVLEDSESSDVVLVELPDSGAIEQARAFMLGNGPLTGGLLIFVLSENLSHAGFLELAGDLGVSLPPLVMRPTDVAHYSRRFARITANQMGKDKAPDFSPEASYALLSHEWPGDYDELQRLVVEAVKRAESDPITLDELELEQPASAPAGDRLARLLQQAQATYLVSALNDSGGSPSALAGEVGVSSVVQSETDLRHLALVKPELAKL